MGMKAFTFNISLFCENWGLLFDLFKMHPNEKIISVMFNMAAFLAKREWRKMLNNNNNHSEVASDPMKQDMRYFMESFETNKKKQSPAREVQNNLKQEILQLERRLQDQSEVRRGLERALGYKPSSFVDSNDIVLPEPATKLIKEIAVLELEVVYLEQHLLSLYRKAFHQQISSAVSPSSKDERLKLSSLRTTPPGSFLEVSNQPNNFSNIAASSPARDQYNGNGSREKLFDSSMYRCHSSLSHSSTFTTRTSPAESFAKAVYACHSRQLSMLEYPETASSSMISLTEHIGTHGFDQVPETPNRISENMVKCISAIYCKLSEPPMSYHGISSPSSSFSSMSAFSIGEQGGNMWSPGFRNNSFFDVGLENPFQVEGRLHGGPYCSMLEVSWIYRDTLKLGDTENLLQNFRSLTCRLEQVDPKKLNHGEKLAFWINVHNALVMHAYLAHGIPQNNVKRVFLLLKASYNVGGRPVSADTIQNTILGCRMSRPGQWVRLLLSPWTKLRSGDRREAYAIECAEPLLHFALCSGNYSDPAVRVYTAKRVMEELEVAKEEYIGATLGIGKEEKIILPKLVEAFAKDYGLSRGGVLEMLQSKSLLYKCHTPKSPSPIQWIPHNFSFRYLFSKDLLLT